MDGFKGLNSIIRWVKDDKMQKIKFFRKNGRVCEEGLEPDDLLEIRDKLFQGYKDSSEDEMDEV